MNIIERGLSEGTDSLTERTIISSMKVSKFKLRLEALKEELAEAEERGDVFMSAMILDEIIDTNFEIKEIMAGEDDEFYDFDDCE